MNTLSDDVRRHKARYVDDKHRLIIARAAFVMRKTASPQLASSPLKGFEKTKVSRESVEAKFAEFQAVFGTMQHAFCHSKYCKNLKIAKVDAEAELANYRAKIVNKLDQFQFSSKYKIIQTIKVSEVI